ncbi:MAG: TIGR03619 family F420-dependent LLM class oxidoreductase [Deltaproteobacteria bacterium]|nr:TIGR03619 family F420-dependent LLM class oxidoreductase [Deltaproteobacteria bacterium]MBW2419573.1 TIGR03619 family F420-dependent LLM class oxidoreductase [Deltaproteobacteria bacterium]
MRFSYAEAMCDPSFYLPLARAAEAAGYDAFVVPDNLGFPGKSDARYPYTVDGDNAFLEDKPFLEPFTLIPAMAAVTERLRFHTLVVKLPVRLPYLVAKQATSIAVLSNNRFGFGVGLSPWPEDFRICGQDWDNRGKRMDEMIEIIRGLAGGGFYEFHGEHYDIQPMKMCPVPSEPIPILIGGHSGPALRRAARLGDGWMHAGGDSSELAGMLERLETLRKEYGRDHLPFEVHVISFDAFEPDGLKRLEDLGVSDVIVGFRNVYQPGPDTQPLGEKIAALEDFANRVIARG